MIQCKDAEHEWDYVGECCIRCTIHQESYEIGIQEGRKQALETYTCDANNCNEQAIMKVCLYHFITDVKDSGDSKKVV